MMPAIDQRAGPLDRLPHNTIPRTEEKPQPAPYSEQWFKQLHAVNPLQAALAAHILERYGAGACCVCGDSQGVLDYRMVGRHASSPGPKHTRLCRDCRAMQGQLWGLQTEPINGEEGQP